ncbi:MAG: hypothetical protein IJS60_04605 [Abditibacteriota bacterium]|nr:hypothetical protein [Abditibacteriota bacterium]
MKNRPDLLGFGIFIIILAGILYLSFSGLVKKIMNYDYSADESLVYVNIDAIDIPESDIHFYDNIGFEGKEPITQFPSLLNIEKYTYKAKALPVQDLSLKSEVSLTDLEETLNRYLLESLEYSKSKNEDFATMQSYFKTRSFEEDARELLHQKIKDNTPYKLSSYINSLAHNGHMSIMNTEKNRKNAGVAFSEYLLYRNAYMNYFYLYKINVERYRGQEKQKTIEELNKKFNEYEALQKEIISQNISSSEKTIKNIINNIDISEENKTFSYQNIKLPDNKKTKALGFSFETISDIPSSISREKQQLIIAIGKDHNYKVTFNENQSLEDKTEEFQNLINKYGYLYQM